MLTNITIFGLDVPNWIFLIIGGAIVFGVIVFILFSLAKKREAEDAIFRKAEEKRKKESEKGYYSLNNSTMRDYFFSTLSDKIRIMWYEKDAKDLLIISSSWPIEMSENDLKNFQYLIPELISIKPINNHQLSFKKSPAAYFFSAKEKILEHLFCYLNNKYAWINKEMIISLHCNPLDRLNCHLQVQTSDHIALGIMLGNISGIINKETTILQMKEKNTYQFDLIKNDNVEWKDLLPTIQEVFQTYFTGGVEFIGLNEI